ncbi:MAG: uridine kinase family protein [Nocardioides sp.]
MPGHAEQVLQRVRSRPPTLGTGRLVCVDGPAGSGKTTLAARTAELAPGTVVVHTDELLEGWSGLPGLAASVEGLLRPLAAGRPGRWRRWDWWADDWAETHTVEPGGLLVLEGVGSAPASCSDLIGCLVWVEAADPAVRLARGLARDGEQMRPQWEQWMRDEAALHATEGTRDRADLVVTTG